MKEAASKSHRHATPIPFFSPDPLELTCDTRSFLDASLVAGGSIPDGEMYTSDLDRSASAWESRASNSSGCMASLSKKIQGAEVQIVQAGRCRLTTVVLRAADVIRDRRVVSAVNHLRRAFAV